MKPSTNEQVPTTVWGIAAFVAASTVMPFVIAACTRSGANVGIVEAPMLSIDASVAALDEAPIDAGPRTAAVLAGDRFTGTYTCAQGRTQLELTIDAVRDEDPHNTAVSGTFTFHYDGSGEDQTAADGSYLVRGTFNPPTRRLILSGVEWVEQPENYEFVTLAGSLNRTGTVYAGTVDGPGCTTFSATLERRSGDREH